MHLSYSTLQVYQDGLNNIRVGYILRHLAYPAVSSLASILALPYIFANGLLPLTGIDSLTVSLQVIKLEEEHFSIFVMLLND